MAGLDTAPSSSSASTLLSRIVQAAAKERKELVKQLQHLSPPYTTAEELLSTDSRSLSKTLRFTSTKEVDDLKAFVSQELCCLYSPSSSRLIRSGGWESFASLFDVSSIVNTNKLSSGFANLDAILPGNGFAVGHIYEILGPAASGKSQVCMSIISSAAAGADDDRKLLYIDTSGSVTHIRICDMIEHNFKRLHGNAPSNYQISVILSRIHVARITDPWTCLNVISTFKHEGLNTNSSGNVVVIDSIHDLFSPYATEEISSNSNIMSGRYKSGGSGSGESKLPNISMEPILAQMILLLRSLTSTTIFISNLTYQEIDKRVICDNSIVWMDGIDGSLLLWRQAATTSHIMIRFMHVGDQFHDDKIQADEEKKGNDTKECLIDFKV